MGSSEKTIVEADGGLKTLFRRAALPQASRGVPPPAENHQATFSAELLECKLAAGLSA
ncbi:hypothetical protein PLANPX_5236 [Lacipirellula parvula]|uniref:Uncharacterized protein n=1 Tax=Lacipirellula parvula TaxID=2650471 RepID=A0A5K7XFI2_9BACT|nr:hypothetical protein PLANPX_5236 [Lacipirellula parvula]